MNFEDQKNQKNKFFEIYTHYLKYNELILYTFFKNNDFNHKYLKLSLLIFYLECIILFNFVIFPNKIFQKIYETKKYPFKDCLINNIFIVLICFGITFGSKFFIGTQHNIFDRIRNNEVKETKITETNTSQDNINLDNDNNSKKMEIDPKEIKKEKKKLINEEIENKSICVVLYFIGVLFVYIYSFIHGISFGIIFQNTQKYVILNMFICFFIGIIFSLIFNLISCFLRYFGIKNEKLFNLSIWLTNTIY